LIIKVIKTMEETIKHKLLLMRPCIIEDKIRHGKTITTQQGLEVCKCGSKRRGPVGGICGNCGQAIPSQEEIDFHKII